VRQVSANNLHHFDGYLAIVAEEPRAEGENYRRSHTIDFLN